MDQPGAFVRPPGWSGQQTDSDGSENESREAPEAPEVVIMRREWEDLNAERPAELQPPTVDERWHSRGEEEERRQQTRDFDRQVRDTGDRVEKRGGRKRNAGENYGSSSRSTSASRSNSDEDRRSSRRRGRRSHRSKKKRKRGSKHRSRRHRSADQEEYERKHTIAQLLKNCTIPALKDEATHDEMRHAWPTWRDMFVDLLEMYRPPSRDWTEEEKYLALMMRGGRHVHEIAAFTTPVAGEAVRDDNGGTPKFSNLIKRCNATYHPKDATTEITILRAMHQKEDESVREFLNKARKQITLCGYRAGEERDRELLLLLKENTIDAREISKQAAGKTLEQMEAVAVNLEGIRQKEKREKAKTTAPPEKEEVDIHAVWDKLNNWAKSNRQPGQGQQDAFRSRGRRNFPPGRDRRLPHEQGRQNPGERMEAGKCSRCARPGGHSPGRECPARDMTCFKCGRKGHAARACRSGESGERQPRQRERVHQLAIRDREATDAGTYQVNKPDNEAWAD